MPRWGYLEITPPPSPHVLDINNEHNWQNSKIHCRNDIYKIKAKSFTVLFGSKSNRNVILGQIYRDVRYGSVCQTHFDISALEVFEMKLYLTHIIWDMCWAKFKWCMSLFVGKGTWHTGVLDCAISYGPYVRQPILEFSGWVKAFIWCLYIYALGK